MYIEGVFEKGDPVAEAINSLHHTLHERDRPNPILEGFEDALIGKIAVFTFAADRACETLKINLLAYGQNGYWRCSNKEGDIVLVPHCSITTIKIIDTKWD